MISSLPRRTTGERAPATPGPAPGGIAQRRSILLVDDNPDFGDVLAQILRGEGHAVEVARDGWAALDLVRRFHPAFALLDLGLPRMDGFELARRMKLEQAAGEPVLVALTGFAEPSHTRRAREVGFVQLLVKPFELPRLLAILQRGPAGAGAPAGRPATRG